MRQKITSEHLVDENGLPAGGHTEGIGFAIDWQKGPIEHPDRLTGPTTSLDVDVGASGAFVEGIIEAAIDRIRWYQTVSNGRFACRENNLAIRKLKDAIYFLDTRSFQRAQRGVLGTHEK